MLFIQKLNSDKRLSNQADIDKRGMQVAIRREAYCRAEKLHLSKGNAQHEPKQICATFSFSEIPMI